MITMKSKKKISYLPNYESFIWGLGIRGSKYGVSEMPTFSLMEKRRKT